jgi:membrane fusion protein, heavy metal efflux system
MSKSLDHNEDKEVTAEVTRAVEVERTPEGVSQVVEVESVSTAAEPRPVRNRKLIIVAAVAVFTIAVVALVLWSRRGARTTEVGVTAEKQREEKGADTAEEVALSPEALAATGIETAGVTQRPAVALLKVTGTVESNQEQTQAVTPLVTGRVERVSAALGDRVRAGQVLAVIASPEVAEMHGKLHEAETRQRLAERNLARVQRAENRSGVLQAKARLDEAEANLTRTRRLIDLGAGAGKDLVAAETAYKTAKAEHDFQSNISLNKELHEAQAEVETSRVDVAHLRESLRVLGSSEPEGAHEDAGHETSLVPLRAPASGVVTERTVNVGAGVEAGKSLFTVANISTVWIIAQVPEAQVGSLHVGSPAEVRSAALGSGVVSGRVNYIDPQLNEETRTGRVRINVANPGERLKVGMFVEVGFQTSAAGAGTTGGTELVVPSEAIQRIGERTIVFVPKDEPGRFEVRDVEVGGEVGEYRRILSGLKLGEKVVTKGSFTLKTQKMKGELGEE